MTFSIVWIVWIFSLPVAGRQVSKWLGPKHSPIVWAGGTAIWPMLLLFLGLNRVVARVLRLDSDGIRAPLEWRD